MANSLTITTSLVDDHWEITGSLTGNPLPPEVFIYNNTGATTLGEYAGICSLAELTRLQKFSGSVIPIFANKFVRTGTLNINVDVKTDTAAIITTIVSSVTKLSAAYKASTNSTQVYTI